MSDVLKTEVATDPLGRGYAGMTDEQVAVDLNTVYRERNKGILTGTQVLNAINKTEFLALSPTKQERIWNVLHLGEINPFGIEAAIFVDEFGGGSTTITTLQALRKESVSRATELGLGKVRVGYVTEARL
jgi:hypothetical protein